MMKGKNILKNFCIEVAENGMKAKGVFKKEQLQPLQMF